MSLPKKAAGKFIFSEAVCRAIVSLFFSEKKAKS